MTINLSAPLVFFGDSLSDPGNLADLSTGLIDEEVRTSIGGPNGQASDGAVWTEVVGDEIGSGPVTNYAIVGAEASGSQTLAEFYESQDVSDAIIVPPDDPALDFDINLSAQVDRFLADTAGQDNSDIVAVIMAGSNDLGNIDLTAGPIQLLLQINATVEAVVSSVLDAAILLLQSGGVDSVVIVSVPPVSQLPGFSVLDPELGAIADGVVDDINAGLSAQLDEFNAELGDDNAFVFLDLDPLYAALADDPGGFGFIAPGDLTLTGTDPAVEDFDADQVAYWDDVHPTEALHGVIAAYAATDLETGVTELTEGDDRAGASPEDSALLGLGGADTLALGGGADIGLGGSGDDIVSGSAGQDIVSGGSGDDVVAGGSGADVIDGSAGDDLLCGQGGNDLLIDGLGSDTVRGGGGDDTFIWIEASLIGGVTGADQDLIRGGDGTDTVYVVLSEENFDLLALEIEGAGETAALASLGLSVSETEDVVVIDGRAGLDAALAGDALYDDADLWGFV